MGERISKNNTSQRDDLECKILLIKLEKNKKYGNKNFLFLFLGSDFSILQQKMSYLGNGSLIITNVGVFVKNFSISYLEMTDQLRKLLQFICI